MHQLSNRMRWFRLRAIWRIVESRCSAWMNALLGPTIGRPQEKNKKQTTGEKRIGRQQKKHCDATHAAEGWRGDDRDAGPRDCGTRRTGPGSVEITDKSARLHDQPRRGQGRT